MWTFKGKSIADVLDMTVEEGVEFFAAVPAVRDKLATLKRVGLGYIKVGQQATTLSGGEAQRVKLAKELSKRSTGTHALHSRRTDHRPSFPRCCQTARSAARTGRPG
jgi:excinuclease UvrABC ATPase subunit